MFTDVNCSIGVWPTRPLPITTVRDLSSHLESESIDLALVSSIEAALLVDPAETNLTLIEQAEGVSRISPVPVVNPRHRRWESMLESCFERAEIRAIKLHLNYHNVEPDAPEVAEVVAAAVSRRVPILVPLRMEDERLSNVRLQAPPVPLQGVITLAKTYPSHPFVVLNAYRNELRAARLPENLYADIAFVEYFKTVESLADAPGFDRLLFGSNTPFFVTRAATMKLAWAGIDDEIRAMIGSEHATAILGNFIASAQDVG